MCVYSVHCIFIVLDYCRVIYGCMGFQSVANCFVYCWKCNRTGDDMTFVLNVIYESWDTVDVYLTRHAPTRGRELF